MVPPLKNLKFLILSFIFSLCALRFALPCYSQSTQQIRVLILQDAASFNLRVKGFYEITDSGGQKILSRDKNLKTTVTAYKNGIMLGNIKSENNKVFIRTHNQDAIIIDGRRFRGDVRIIKKDNLQLSVVNYVDLEDYIKGILYHEASHYWPIETLKAQAIACRTYALYQIQESKSKDYDLTSDIYSQVYGGRTSERSRTNKAVDQTKNIVLTYQDKLFPAYYHATCAGYTEDASLLWNINIAPLKGVACNFCKDSPHFNWHCVLSIDEIKDKLANSGYKINNIKNIAVLGKDNSGRITDLNIISADKETKISAKDFRNIIGPNIIKSTNFNVTLINNDAVFEGLGWGHGVGLCQWGAYFMAKTGYKYEGILKYYYPGADVKTLRF